MEYVDGGRLAQKLAGLAGLRSPRHLYFGAGGARNERWRTRLSRDRSHDSTSNVCLDRRTWTYVRSVTASDAGCPVSASNKNARILSSDATSAGLSPPASRNASTAPEDSNFGHRLFINDRDA